MERGTKAERTKYDMAKAIKELMKTATVEEITVKDICEKSNVSRQTFYRNFLDKYDLINWYFDKLLNESFSQMGSGKTVEEGLIRKFDYIREERVFFTAAFGTDTQNNLKDHDFEMIFAFYKDLIRKKSGRDVPTDIESLLEMYCQASIYMTVKWVLGGMQMTSQELAQLMIDAMPEKLSALMEELHILA